jgi:two-component system sensor histidine kinase HydH
MAAGLAHEIRNPTAAISAQAQYLLKKMGKESRAYRSQLQDVLVQCERLETLIRDTLDYSPQKKFEEREEVQAKALLNKALKLAQTQFGPDHGRMKVKLKFGLRLPILSIHPGRMERVLVNLILNAFQAMPQGGLLTLEAKRIKNKIALRVEDNGKGLAGVEIAKLFEPFYTSRKTGSGLGLAICQKIVEEHGGEIRAEKRKPKGAAFIVELPLRDGDGA